MAGNKLGFAIIDVDNNNLTNRERTHNRQVSEPIIMSASNLKNPNDLGSVLVPSHEISRI